MCSLLVFWQLHLTPANQKLLRQYPIFLYLLFMAGNRSIPQLFVLWTDSNIKSHFYSTLILLRNLNIVHSFKESVHRLPTQYLKNRNLKQFLMLIRFKLNLVLVRLKLYLWKINWIKCTLFTLYFICNRENTTTVHPVFLHLSDIVTSHIPYPYRRKNHSDSPPTHLTYPDSLSWPWPSTVYKSGTPAIRGDPVGGNYHHYHADIIRTAIDLSDTSSYMNFTGDYSTAYYGLSPCIFLVSVWALRLALHIADHARGFLSVHIVYDICPSRSRFDGFIGTVPVSNKV